MKLLYEILTSSYDSFSESGMGFGSRAAARPTRRVQPDELRPVQLSIPAGGERDAANPDADSVFKDS